MLNRRTAIVCGAVLLVLASSFGVGVHAPRYWHSAPAEVYPPKLSQEVFIPTQDGKKIAYIRYQSVNGVRTKVSGVVFYDQEHDGIIDYLTFDKKGYIARSEKYFPLAENEEERGVLRRLAEYRESGSRFKTHSVYRKDTTLERSGELLRDGRYHIRYFFEDGVTVSRERFFTSNLVLSFERVHRNDKDHTTVSETRLLGNDVDKEYSKTFFNELGTRIARIQKGPLVGTKGEVFSADGNQVVASYERTPWATQEHFFREDGTQTQARLGYMNSVTSMIFGGEDNRMQYRQTWRTRPAVDGKPQRFILSRVTEFDLSGKELRTIEMMNDGSRPDYVSYPLSNTRKLVKYLDSDGLIVRTEVKEGDTLVSTSTGPDLPLTFDKRIFLRENPVEIAYFDFNEPGAPAWIYDYEDNQYPLVKSN